MSYGSRGDGSGWRGGRGGGGRSAPAPFKRSREDDDEEDHGPARPRHHQYDPSANSSSHRPSVEDAQSKLARRREERQEKKERERTLSYFTAVGQAVRDANGDAALLSSIADGFFSELAKRLQSGSAEDLLRNGTVCRTIEAAVTSSGSLLHCKSTIYLLLGKSARVMTSPTASFVMEALLACVACAAGHLLAERGDLAKETEGDVGVHAGSGVPSTLSILRALVDEVIDHMEELLLNPCSSKCLRTLVMCLAGSRAALAKLPPSRWPEDSTGKHLPAFPDLLATLAEAFVRSVERVFANGQGSADCTGNAWAAAATTVSSSLVLQAFLEHACDDARFPLVGKLIRQDRVEKLRVQGLPLLAQLMTDPVGSHVFQSYLRTRWGIALKEYFAPHMERLVQDVASSSASAEVGKTEGFILQDFVLFAPDEPSMKLLWENILSKSIPLLLSTPLLSSSIVRFSRKCAYGARAELSDSLDDTNSLVVKDMQAGAPYFGVSSGLRAAFVTTVTNQLKQLPDGTKKGAAFSLLVGHAVGGEVPSYELALNLLLCGRQAAMQFVHSFEKLRTSDLTTIATNPQGTYVLQQLARLLAAESSHQQHKAAGAAKATAQQVDSSAVAKFQRRLLPHLEALASNKFAAFLVETLYDLGTFAAKEEERAHGRQNAALGAAAPKDKEEEKKEGGEVDGRFFLRKVLLKCCVEQFSVNAEQWRAAASREAHVKKLMHSILSSEGL